MHVVGLEGGENGLLLDAQKSFRCIKFPWPEEAMADLCLQKQMIMHYIFMNDNINAFTRHIRLDPIHGGMEVVADFIVVGR